MNRDRYFLLDIIDLIDTITRHRPAMEDAFTGDEVLLTATVHWVQTIGEAANAISEATRRGHPEVPWRPVVDMRNLLAHGYRHVSPSIVWQVIIRDLPVLRGQILAVLDGLQDAD